jgi:hypothetical protein
MPRLSTEQLSIGHFLRSRRRLVLPPSQRVYAWREEQIARLFADFGINVAPVGLPEWFFFGTIYLAEKPDDAETIVADGQQRCVTATMVLAALRDLEDDPARKQRLQEYVALPGSAPEAAGSYRLHLRDVDAAFFRQWVQTPGATLLPYASSGEEEGEAGDTTSALSESRSNIITNRNLIVDKLREIGTEGRAALLRFMEDETELIVISATDIADAQHAYASTYKRGLRQAETDKLKSEIIGDVEIRSRARLANYWDESEAKLGKEGLEELLHLLVLLEAGRETVQDLLSELTRHFRLPGEVVPFIEQRLVPVTDAYASILKAPNGLARHLSPSLRTRRHFRTVQDCLITLNRTPQPEWRAPMMVALQSLSTDLQLLQAVAVGLDRMVAAYLIAGHDPHLANKRYCALADAISSRSPETIERALIVEGAVKTKARGQLAAANFAQKARFRMPVLLKINDLFAGRVLQIDPATVSCEHVLPQGVNRNTPGWYERFRSGRDRRFVGHLYRHKLGNVTILSHIHNRRCGNLPYVEKRPILQNSEFAMTKALARTSDWTAEAVDARQEELIRRLVAHWKL